jgi:glycosyltransferase involved in cell wall biosynthesis
MAIDILMPVHNGEMFLRETLNSINNQSYEDWRLVAVLDRCEDQSEQLIRELIPASKLCISHVKFGHIGKNLNYGLRQCTSDFVARFDCDDIMLPNRLDVQVKFLNNHPEITVVASDLVQIDKDGNQISKTCFPNSHSQIADELLLRNCIPHPSVMYRRLDIEECGGYTEVSQQAEDYDLWLRLISKGKKIELIPLELIKYRLHQNQVSRKLLAPSDVRLLADSQKKTAIFLNRKWRGRIGRFGFVTINHPVGSRMFIWNRCSQLLKTIFRKVTHRTS